jgi:uncharacterized protein YceK
MNFKNIFSSVVIMISLSSCATILTKTEQEVTFDSVPQGAAIMLNDAQIGITPATILLKKKNEGPIILQLAGHIDKEVPVKRTLNPVFLGNIITGGLAGSATDTSTGAINEYNPGQYSVTLQKLPTAGEPAAAETPAPEAIPAP